MTERERAEQLVQLYLDLQVEYAGILKAVATAKDQARAAVLALGEDVQADGGRARIVAGYERTSWNADVLRFLHEQHPEVGILDAAKVTSVRPYVAIEV